VRVPNTVLPRTPSLITAALATAVAELVGAGVWWYGGGRRAAWRRFRHRLDLANDYTGWSIWLTNLVTPMYGQTDLSGRLISFVVRLIQACIRTVVFACWSLGAGALFLAYLALPALTLIFLVSELRLLVGS
jgi:hypothetical protein